MIKLDKNRDFPQIISKKQYDTLEKLTIELNNNNIPIKLSEYKIRLECFKSDMKIVIQNENIIVKNTNQLEILLDPQITIVEGKVACQIVLVKDGLSDTSFTFFINVQPSIIKKGSESKSVVTILDNLIENIEKAIVENSKTENLIETGGAATKGEVAEVSEQLAEITHLSSSFKRLAVETNDRARLLRILEHIPEGATLKLNEGTYELNGQDIIIEKPVNILATSRKATIFNNGGIVFEASNVVVDKLFIKAPNLDNGFEAHSKAVNNITITSCYAEVKDHGFLFESYNGAIETISVEKCTAINSTHGFISKALGVKFIDCNASNISSYGFGIISDNIPANGKNAQAWNNVIKNCYAYNCGYGLRVYCRDKWNEVCAVSNKNNAVEGLICNSCTYPFHIGEVGIPSGYLSTQPIKNSVFTNLQSYSTKSAGEYSLYINNVSNCRVNNFILDKGYSIVNADDETKKSMGISTITSNVKGYILATDNQLDINNYNIFDIQGNSTTTNKIMLVGTPIRGQKITIFTRSSGSTFNFGGFDEAKFVVPTEIKTSFTLSSKDVQISEWVYMTISNKWICTNLYDSKF